MEEFGDCDDADSSSDDGGILFSRSSLKGERASNGRSSSTGPSNDAESSSPTAMSLVYQPGAILQCFELAVASHDDPDPSTAPSWEAPPLSNPVQSQQPQSDTAAPVDECSDGEILPPSFSSSPNRPASHASILRDWKPRAFLLDPDWMTTSDDLGSGAAPPAASVVAYGNGLDAEHGTDPQQQNSQE